MVPDLPALLAIIVLLFSFGYFAMASPSFLFVRLDIPEVWRLFRGLLNIYFRVIGVVGVGAALAFGLSGHLSIGGMMLWLAVAALAFRAPVLQRIDMDRAAGGNGDAAALRRLRFYHWGFMLLNLALLASVAASIPFVL